MTDLPASTQSAAKDLPVPAEASASASFSGIERRCICGRVLAQGGCWLTCEKAEACLATIEANSQSIGTQLGE